MCHYLCDSMCRTRWALAYALSYVDGEAFPNRGIAMPADEGVAKVSLRGMTSFFFSFCLPHFFLPNFFFFSFFSLNACFSLLALRFVSLFDAAAFLSSSTRDAEIADAWL